MKTHLWIAAVSLCILPVSYAEDSAPGKTSAPKIEVGAEVTLTGNLEGGMNGIGGETTGWSLQYPYGKETSSIEVDVKAIKDVEKLDGKDVTISGKIISKQYLERGKVMILVAKKIEPKP